MKITLEITHEGWFKAVIPALLPKNVGASQWFIREPLNRELQDFFLVYRNTHNGKSFGIECGVIIFKHFYNRNRPQRMNHDLDNYEENGIVDSIAFYILPDDDAKHCFHLHMMEPADTDYTEVHVVPQSQFIYWLMQNGFSNEKPDDTQDFSLKKEKLYSILPPHEENQKAESIPI
jgi:hypothetical protein